MLVDNKLCKGCGRTWEQIRDWSFYSDKQRDDIIEQLKDFKPLARSRFSE